MEDNSREVMNTDRELWRESDSYYAPSAFVTEQGAIGIQVGGLAIVKTVTGWHNCAQLAEQLSIAEQARAAEQGKEMNMQNMTIGGPVVCHNCGQHYNCAQDIHVCKQPAQPSAGDVLMVERMCSDYGNLTGTDPDPVAMTAALAVAREGYVSLEDVEAAIDSELHNRDFVYTRLDRQMILRIAKRVRARLAKPAAQTDEQKVEAILKHIWNAPVKYSDHLLQEIAAEIVAALKAGKQ